MFVSAQYGIRFALRLRTAAESFFQFPRFIRVIATGPQPRRRFRRKTDRKTGRFSPRERNPHTKRANIRIISQNTKPKPLVLTFRAHFSKKRFTALPTMQKSGTFSVCIPADQTAAAPPASPRKAASARDFRSRHFEASVRHAVRPILSRWIFGWQLFGRRVIAQTASRPAGPRSIAFQPTDPRPAIPRSTNSSAGSSSVGRHHSPPVYGQC